jgi:hypothetical protein
LSARQRTEFLEATYTVGEWLLDKDMATGPQRLRGMPQMQCSW